MHSKNIQSKKKPVSHPTDTTAISSAGPWYRRFAAIGIAIGILLIAFIPRLVYFNHLQTTPYFDGKALYRIDGLDQKRFLDKAEEIVRDGIINRGSFSQTPLYPYIIAGIFKIFGKSVPAVRMAQLLMGALTCVLIFLIGKELFGTATGILAGLISAFYPVSIFYEGVLLRASLSAFMNVLLVFLLLVAFRRDRPLWWSACGMCYGLCFLLRPNLAIAGPFMVFWIIVAFRHARPSSIAKILAYVAMGTACVFLLLSVRNILAGAPALHLRSDTAKVFYFSNAPDALGNGYIIPDSFENAPKDRLVAAAMQAALENPWDYAKLLGRKLHGFFNGFETPNNSNFYLYQDFSWVLKNPVLSLSVIMPLAVLGLCISLTGTPKRMLPGLFVLSGLVAILVFYMLSRFRYPYVPFMIILASYACVWIWQRITEKQVRPLMLALVVLIPCTALAVPRPFSYGYISPNDYFNFGVAYGKLGRNKTALPYLEKALELNPDSRLMRGEYYFYKGNLLTHEKKYREAAEAYKQAVKATPDNEQALLNHLFAAATYFVQQKRYGPAVAAYREILRITPGHPTAQKNLDYCLARISESEKELR